MTRAFKGSLYYLYANSRYSLTIFWSILIGILLLSIAGVMLASETVFSFQMSAPIYIFSSVMGFWVVKNVIPYVIKLGGTRRYLSVALFVYAILLSLANAILANIVYNVIHFLFGSEKITSSITVTSEGSTIAIDHIGDFIGNNTFLERIIIDTSISFFLIGAFLLVGLFFYRYGLIGGFIFLAIGIVLFIFGMSDGWLIYLLERFFPTFEFRFFYQLFFAGVILFVLAYPLLRRLTVK